ISTCEEKRMEKKNTFTKVLAIAGTSLVWLPILAPILFSVISLVAERIFRFDYLMPAELFPLVIIGSGLLLWAALRAMRLTKLIGFSLAAASGALVLSQAAAVATGIASGRTEAAGLWWTLILALFAIFFLSVVLIAVGGVLLVRYLFKRPQALIE
ncbi:MAG: hypothetical protein MUO42_06560, partial [Anaerolineaceae bacterium]|nr:hypothetical protein [Anaerolineaceae bacterium]